MKTRLILVLGALVLLGGCSVGASSNTYPSASPDTSWDQRYCDSRGGYWNRNANVCESPLNRW